MALTESRLRQIVREEARRVMREGPYRDPRDRGTMWDPDADRYGRGDKGDFGGDDYDIEYSDPDVEDEEEYEGDDY